MLEADDRGMRKLYGEIACKPWLCGEISNWHTRMLTSAVQYAHAVSDYYSEMHDMEERSASWWNKGQNTNPSSWYASMRAMLR